MMSSSQQQQQPIFSNHHHDHHHMISSSHQQQQQPQPQPGYRLDDPLHLEYFAFRRALDALESHNPNQNVHQQPSLNIFQNNTQNYQAFPSHGEASSSQVNYLIPSESRVQIVGNRPNNIFNNPNFTNFRDHAESMSSETESDEEILDPEPLRVFVPRSQEKKDEEEKEKNEEEEDEEDDEEDDDEEEEEEDDEEEEEEDDDKEKEDPDDDEEDENPNGDHYQDVVMSDELISSPRETSDGNHRQHNDDDNDKNGRIHSLSRKKTDPYTCPKCERVFEKSQSFAAHVVAFHYRNETLDDRKKRFSARYKSGNLRVVQSRFKHNVDWRKKSKRATIKIEADDDNGDQVQK